MAVPVQGAGEELVLGRRKREWPLAVLLLLPSAAVFGVFVFYPLVRTVQLGMYRSDPFGGLGRYVGLSQYGHVLTSEPFRRSLWISLRFAAIVVPTVVVAMMVTQ